MAYGADTDANALMVSLLQGETYTIPVIDFNGPDFQFPYDLTSQMFQPITKLTNADLTTQTIGGTGTFDVLMSAAMAHLQKEFKDNRISGAEYTKAYIGTITAAMQMGVQFLVQRDQAYWQAQTAQLEALNSRIKYAEAKLEAAGMYYQAVNARATYALTKLKLATEDVQFGTGKYQVDNLLPVQKFAAQEQGEAARAQTQDVRSDGNPVVGSVGKQKALYDQQITSYKRDAEVKAVKLWTDAWITMKSIDDGLTPPDQFTNANITTLLTQLRSNNGFS